MRLLANGVLAGTLVLAGCHSPVILGGEYRNRGARAIATELPDKTTLVDETRWTFLWGLFESRTIDVESALARQLHGPDECFTNLEVKQYQTIPGKVLGWITFGLLGHEEVEVKGRRANLGSP